MSKTAIGSFQKTGLLIWFQDTKEEICCKISWKDFIFKIQYVGKYDTQSKPKIFQGFQEMHAWTFPVDIVGLLMFHPNCMN